MSRVSLEERIAAAEDFLSRVDETLAAPLPLVPERGRIALLEPKSTEGE